MKNKEEWKGWQSFEEFISEANKNCNWLVLRNFEYLPNNFFENDKDVDILCEDINFFVKTMKLKKRSWGIGSYETIIDYKVVPFDVRFLGDGYYDKLWQFRMLENKIYTSDNVPRMNDEDYFYSLIYHSKIQKTEVKEIYKERLYNLSKKLGIEEYNITDILNDKYIGNLLSKFMEKNHYNFSKPLDINVPKNNSFFQYLSPCVQKGLIYNTPIKAIILRFIPNILIKIIPKNVKAIIRKVF